MSTRFSTLGLAAFLVIAPDVSAQPTVTIAAQQPIQVMGSTYTYRANGTYTLAAGQIVDKVQVTLYWESIDGNGNPVWNLKQSKTASLAQGNTYTVFMVDTYNPSTIYVMYAELYVVGGGGNPVATDFDDVP